MQHSELPTDINPGIVRLVTILRAHDFQTTDSGDGETHAYECDRSYGYVVIRVEDPANLVPESHRLQSVLLAYGIRTGPMVEENEESPPTIQANYSPDDGFAFIDLSHVHDRQLAPPVDRNGLSRHRKRKHPIPAFHTTDRSRIRIPKDENDTDAVSPGFLRGWMECAQDDCEGCSFAGIGGWHMRHDPHVPTYIPEASEEEWLAGYFAAIFNWYVPSRLRGE